MTKDQETELLDRFSLAVFLEAVRCLDENVSTAKEIDIAMRAGAGLPEGPLGHADKLGLDKVLARLQALQAQYGERFQPPERLLALVAAGRTGVEAGRGFLDY
ncbi:MAG: 3-hydroxyacyl-CoA dehydrogenase family protein [Thermaerobacter sp.]|nr:3-hydroxyacyl-CoA dehydrogenase family protein [Thermaerobacter sp.]